VRSAAVLILPSVMEGWGLVLCEATARYVPYVAYDIPAVREQHEVLRGGILAPAGDVPRLAAGLELLLTDPDLRRELGRRGHDAARERLSWANAAAVADRALREAVAERDGRIGARMG